MSEDEDMKRLKDACETLGEFFDTVHVFATRYNDDGEGGTVNANYGTGNWFARYGHVREWLIKADERSRNEIREND